MMPSSSQVLDHQLIFHIMYGLRQFHHRQNKGEERRGEGRFGKKSNNCLTNIERKRCKKKQLLLPKHRGQERRQKQRRGEIWQKKAGAASQKSNSCHTDFARSHMNIICLISSEPDRQIEQSEVVDSSSREVVELVDRSTSS